MDEETKRNWDVRLGIAAPILTLASVMLGVWQFNQGEANRRADDVQNALLKDDVEFRRKLWLEKLDRYRSISELVGEIIASPPGKTRAAAQVRFESAYWGYMILVSDKEVADALIGFRQALQDEKDGLGDPNDPKVWADRLVQACRKALEQGSPENLRRR